MISDELMARDMEYFGYLVILTDSDYYIGIKDYSWIGPRSRFKYVAYAALHLMEMRNA